MGKALVCMNRWLKNQLAWLLQGKVDQETLQKLAALPECEDKMLDIQDVKGASGIKGESEYVKFTRECMKELKNMEACAERWREIQKNKES